MTTSTSHELTLIKLGGFLISRYLQVIDHRSQEQRSPRDCPTLLKKLEELLSLILDRSFQKTVTVIAFKQPTTHSYLIEFNAPLKMGTSIESTLVSLFDTQPTPISIERYMGAATDCFKLSQTPTHSEKTNSKTKQIGMTPASD